MAERGRGRGGGGRGGRGRGATTIGIIAQKLNTSIGSLRQIRAATEPQPLFPSYIMPRPTKLSKEEVDMVKYYRNIRNKIAEETPFYITPRKRPADDEDDGIDSRKYWLTEGIVRYRDKYTPKHQRMSLRGLPTGACFTWED
jgi:DNA-directed RNA polymerase III subunit Rpc31